MFWPEHRDRACLSRASSRRAGYNVRVVRVTISFRSCLHSISYSFPSQRLCDLLRQKKLQSGTSPRCTDGTVGCFTTGLICEHHPVHKNAVYSGDYLVSPRCCCAWRHQQMRNTQAMRLREYERSGPDGGPFACRSNEVMLWQIHLILLPTIVQPLAGTGCSPCSTQSAAWKRQHPASSKVLEVQPTKLAA